MKNEDVPEDLHEDGKLPDCFNAEKLTPIDIICVCFWDETHKKQRVGRVRGNTKLQCQFPRSSRGELDPVGGKPANPQTELKMKCEKEARFMTGMCLKLDKNGNAVHDAEKRILGAQLPLLEHTEQTIVSHTDWKKAEKSMIAKAKSAGDKSKWVGKSRLKNRKCKEAPVHTPPGVKADA